MLLRGEATSTSDVYPTLSRGSLLQSAIRLKKRKHRRLEILLTGYRYFHIQSYSFSRNSLGCGVACEWLLGQEGLGETMMQAEGQVSLVYRDSSFPTPHLHGSNLKIFS